MMGGFLIFKNTLDLDDWIWRCFVLIAFQTIPIQSSKPQSLNRRPRQGRIKSNRLLRLSSQYMQVMKNQKFPLPSTKSLYGNSIVEMVFLKYDGILGWLHLYIDLPYRVRHSKLCNFECFLQGQRAKYIKFSFSWVTFSVKQ